MPEIKNIAGKRKQIPFYSELKNKIQLRRETLYIEVLQNTYKKLRDFKLFCFLVYNNGICKLKKLDQQYHWAISNDDNLINEYYQIFQFQISISFSVTKKRRTAQRWSTKRSHSGMRPKHLVTSLHTLRFTLLVSEWSTQDLSSSSNHILVSNAL